MHIRVYSKCDSVKVSLNGEAIAVVHPTMANRFNASVVTPFEPGVLSAACIHNSNSSLDTSSQTNLTSSGEPHSLRIVADRTAIDNSPNDLVYARISVIDSKGVLCDHQRHSVRVSFATTGGTLFRVGNGDPVDTDSFTSSERSTWRGSAVAVLRPEAGSIGGEIMLNASAPGLIGASLAVHVRARDSS